MKKRPLAMLVGLWIVASLPVYAEPPRPRSTAELLVDLARDHALNCRGGQTAKDVAQVRCLLDAATRLDAARTDALTWLYELAVLDGDTAAATAILQRLHAAEPEHDGVFAQWLARTAEAQQTAEQRQQWLKQLLDSKLPLRHRALVHLSLAQLAWERMDAAAARQELKLALNDDPQSLAAARMLQGMVSADAPAAERLAAALRILRVNPLDAASAWQAANVLDQNGYAAGAAQFFDYAAQLHERMYHGSALPGALSLALAHNLEARGLLDDAIRRVQAAIAADPSVAAEAGLYLNYLLETKAPGSGTEVRQQLSTRFAALRDPKATSLDEVAQAAWFYTVVEPQPDRALMLAQDAAERAPHDAFVARILGWALAANGKAAEAEEALKPHATDDVFAAARLAGLMLERGDRPAAQRILEGLAHPPLAGPGLVAWQHAQALLNAPPDSATSKPAGDTSTDAAPTTAPAAPRPTTRPVPELDGVLASFDTRVFDYVAHPGRYLAVRFELVNARPQVGEPWRARCVLENKGSFAITLGPDALVNPTFIVSARVESSRTLEYPGLLTFTLDQASVLEPGQTLSLERTLDVGPLRAAARITPQQAVQVIFSVLLDAGRDAQGRWVLQPGGQQLPPVMLTRMPTGASPGALQLLREDVQSKDPQRQTMAAVEMAQLLGEQQRAAAGQLSYTPPAVPATTLEDALVGLLASDSWETRARTLVALDAMGLNRRMLAAAEDCGQNPHWLVRLLATRVLARQGAAFSARAAQIARDDTDELVRRFAQTFVVAQPPTSEPAPATTP